MNKERIIIVCPGRGSYSRETSNYLSQHGKNITQKIKWMDGERHRTDKAPITYLDSSQFKSKIHMVGENASALIFACSFSDFHQLDDEKYEIVAITGNSMGWYTSLVLSGSLNLETGFHLIETMGSMMKDEIIGGQLIYPLVDNNWVTDEVVSDKVLTAIKDRGLYISIKLGGYIVVGGQLKQLKALSEVLPKVDKYPFIIPYHAAFHTPMLDQISKSALKLIDTSIFERPKIPLIDGRGDIWTPFGTDTNSLRDYTLSYQVINTYDFSSSINVALKEFCPDRIVLLGPGNSLGGVVGQILVNLKWLGLSSKKEFTSLQSSDPYVVSLGLLEQRKLLV